MKIVALAGGVGGAKLADGLVQLLSPQDLTVVVNTGDDFEHFGLYISPDLDTVCYTLAGLMILKPAGAAARKPSMPWRTSKNWADQTGSTWVTRTWRLTSSVPVACRRVKRSARSRVIFAKPGACGIPSCQ